MDHCSLLKASLWVICVCVFWYRTSDIVSRLICLPHGTGPVVCDAGLVINSSVDIVSTSVVTLIQLVGTMWIGDIVFMINFWWHTPKFSSWIDHHQEDWENMVLPGRPTGSWTVLGRNIDASAGHVSFIAMYTGGYDLSQAVRILPVMAGKKNLHIHYPGLIDGSMNMTDHQ